MIVRLVKLQFLPEKVDEFKNIFEDSKEKIRSFPGVQQLQLLNDKHQSNIFFTYSIWENEVALENYRHSELFKSTWAKTKVLFNAKPEAWSTEQLHKLD